MIRDKLAIRMRGKATFDFFKGEEFIERISKRNAIQVIAKDITAKNLIRDDSSLIDNIALYLEGNLVFSRLITDTGIVGIAEVFFQTTFAPEDFNGSFDAARLTASGIGDFSIINNLVGSKNSTESLLVTWNIQIV